MAQDARLRLVVSGVVVSVAIHALLLTALALIPEPEKEPDCPTREEVCRAVCLARPEPVIPAACPEPQPCDCELVVVEPIPEIVAMPTQPTVVPEVVPLPPVVPEALPPPPEPPPPPAASEPPARMEKGPVKAKKKNRKARDKAAALAKSLEVARILGTVGGSEGTVLDVIESTDNNLGELFAQGMTTTVAASGELDSSALAGAGGGGSIDVAEESLGDAISRKLRKVQKCHTKDTVGAGVEGKLRIALTIDDAGTPTSVTVESDTTGSEEVRSCVVGIVEGWRLPPSNAGETKFSVVFKID